MTPKTDAQIQEQVIRELKWDTRVDATDIGVAVHRGTITLTGAVNSWAKKLAALEAAHRVAGVLDVANDIEVKLPGDLKLDDTAIAQAVRQALKWSVLVPDDRIQSTVSTGMVTLDGEVDFWTEYEDAERAVHNLAGVCGVRNRIRIQPSKIAHDVRNSIQEALERHTEREVQHIGLSVREGVVELSGKVRSWAEKQAVLGATKGTKGVRFIDDHLSIEP